MGNSPMSGLAFTLFCLTTATMILRPGEMVTALAPIPFYEVLILSTLALAHQGVLQHFKIDSLKSESACAHHQQCKPHTHQSQPIPSQGVIMRRWKFFRFVIKCRESGKRGSRMLDFRSVDSDSNRI